MKLRKIWPLGGGRAGGTPLDPPLMNAKKSVLRCSEAGDHRDILWYESAKNYLIEVSLNDDLINLVKLV